ncbi:hypothetical protein GDO86_019744 [Hymenochirus boettgeri]|uniref:RUN and SH3 domain containing 2 n=1 Tax=Hymenochirus boettgeri TaxID=247094 RepID=A0A8T2IEA1_9PIPI|nr:hypothetical protein GDO86_019744 [Hymenochirus boettgeri]
MDSPPKLAGETLIVHHIPLVHCQVPDRQCGSTSKRSHSYSQLGLTRTTSLPERELSQADSLVYSSLIQASEPSERVTRNEEDWQGPSTRKRHNPFLPNEEESENDFGGGSSVDKSFRLHGTSSIPKSCFHFKEPALPAFHLHEVPAIVKPWIVNGRPGLVDGQEEKTSQDDLQINGNQGPSELITEEHIWNNPGAPAYTLDWNQGSDLGNQDLLQSRECNCNSFDTLRHCRCYSASSQSEMDQQVSYVSDSSCNSSDGILVNFSTLYHKMNGQPRSNLNSGSLSCDSSFCSHPDTGAFYLDLQSSPTESKMSCDSHLQEGPGKQCVCHNHPSSPVLDANCNSYHLHCDSGQCPAENSDLTSCLQSQARLVVATQNYYKLVTCDLSSQSSPSPAGSSITSCSDEHTKGSPLQPTEYFLFQQPDTDVDTNEPKGPIERSKSDIMEGQVYVNVSPPNVTTGRQRSRSYDRSLDKSPSTRLGSLERMLSCPVKLSEGQLGQTQESSPKRVTSFLELAKSRKKNGSSPPLRNSGDSSLEFSPIPEFHRDSSGFSERGEFRSHSLPPMSFLHCMSRTCEGCTVDSCDNKATSSNQVSVANQTLHSGDGGTDHMMEPRGSGLSFLQLDLRSKGDDIIFAHYEPVGFLSVSHGVCHNLFEELLLLLQPLSLLPFDLDLLFEYHLVQMGREQQRKKEMLRVKQDLMQSVHSTLQLMRSREEEELESQEKTMGKADPDVSGMERPTGEGAASVEFDQKKETSVEVKKDKQAGWWYQLMQSSQVYIESSSDSARFSRQERRKPGTNGTPKKVPPPREGVVEGAESCSNLEVMVEEKGTEDKQKEEQKSWMGSPPESVLNELKRGKENSTAQKDSGGEAQGDNPKENVAPGNNSAARKWGHLFGSRRSQGECKQPNRMPSGWLSLDTSVLQIVAQTVSAGIWGEATPEKGATVSDTVATPTSPSPLSPRQVKPLSPETGQGAFAFPYTSNSDELRCGLTGRNGLMPLKYVPHHNQLDS